MNEIETHDFALCTQSRVFCTCFIFNDHYENLTMLIQSKWIPKVFPQMRHIYSTHVRKINHVAIISFLSLLLLPLFFLSFWTVFTNNIFISLSSVGKDPILSNAFCKWCHLTINRCFSLSFSYSLIIRSNWMNAKLRKFTQKHRFYL